MSAARLISLNQRSGKLHQILHVRGAESIVGRQEGCRIRIPSASVSRKHCRLAFDNELLTAEDLGSSNGTFVNDIRISEMSYVKPGDVLRVGPFRFLVHYQLSDRAVQHLLQYLTGRPDAEVSGYDVDVLDDSVLALDEDVPVAHIDPDAPTSEPQAGAPPPVARPIPPNKPGRR